MRRYIYGIDISMVDTGIYRLNRKTLHGHAESVTSKAGEQIDDRLGKVADSVAAIVQGAIDKRSTVDLVVIEGLSLGSHSSSQMERAALHFMIRERLRRLPVQFIVVSPLTVKKFTSNTGKAEKSLMMKEVYKRYGVDLNNDNQADACALSYFGLAWIGSYKMDKDQQLVMKKFNTQPMKKGRKKATE